MDDLLDFVLERARRQLPAGDEHALTGPDIALRAAGLGSLHLVALISELEDELRITFPAAALSLENFHSAATIARLTRRLLSARQQAPDSQSPGTAPS